MYRFLSAVACLVAVFSTQSFANQRTPLIASVLGANRFHEATVDANRVLRVYRIEDSSNPQGRLIARVQLSQGLFSLIAQELEHLSSASAQIEHHESICYMVPDHPRGTWLAVRPMAYNYNHRRFEPSGNPRWIYSLDDCTVGTVFRLADDGMRAHAQNVMAAIAAIALQAMGDRSDNNFGQVSSCDFPGVNDSHTPPALRSPCRMR